jgi:hypothetical protein
MLEVLRSWCSERHPYHHLSKGVNIRKAVFRNLDKIGRADAECVDVLVNNRAEGNAPLTVEGLVGCCAVSLLFR